MHACRDSFSSTLRFVHYFVRKNYKEELADCSRTVTHGSLIIPASDGSGPIPICKTKVFYFIDPHKKCMHAIIFIGPCDLCILCEENIRSSLQIVIEL